MTDLRFALRSLSRAPGFTLVTILTLALGIGSTTAIFSVVNSVLIRPLPFAAPGELVVARGSLADLRDVSAGTTAFQATAVWGSNLYNLDAGGDTRQVRGAIVSPQMLPVLGVSPLLGRTFTDEDDRSDTVILSYGLWQSSFGGDPAVLGRTIQLTGAPYTVIGVTPPWFRFPSSDYVLWTPLGSAEARTPTQIRNRALRIFSLVGRLAPGVTLQRARADVAAVAARLSHDYPQTNADVSIAVRPLSEYLVGDLRGSLLVVFGAVSLLLLIACANVANLMLARTTLRQRELAIRAALGAGRGRLLRQLTAESLLLAVGGGAVGLLLAMWGVDALPAALDARLPRADGVQLDAAVLFFASGATLLTALLFGVAPAALSVSTAGVSPLLTTREASASPRARRARGAIVVAEIALAMIVIVGAGLMVRTFTALSERDPGFDPARLMTFHLQLVNQPGDEARIQVLGAVLARLRGITGIEAAGGSSGFPVVAAQRGTRLAAEGRQLSGNEDSAFFMAATPEYFRALGTPVLQGRAFSDADTAAAPPVIVINRRLAESVFKGVDPIGRRIRLLNPDQRDDWRTDRRRRRQSLLPGRRVGRRARRLHAVRPDAVPVVLRHGAGGAWRRKRAPGRQGCRGIGRTWDQRGKPPADDRRAVRVGCRTARHDDADGNIRDSRTGARRRRYLRAHLVYGGVPHARDRRSSRAWRRPRGHHAADRGARTVARAPGRCHRNSRGHCRDHHLAVAGVGSLRGDASRPHHLPGRSGAALRRRGTRQLDSRAASHAHSAGDGAEAGLRELSALS